MDANTKYQVVAGAVGVLGTGGVAGLMAYWGRAKIDVWRSSRGAEVQAGQAPIQVLLKIVENKEKESAELRADMKLLLTNHLEHDKQEREELVKAFAKQTETLSKACDLMSSRREAEAARAERLTDDIRDISTQIAVLEAKIPAAVSAAVAAARPS